MMYITVHEHSDHDLLQLTDEDLLELPEEVLQVLSVKLLNDLKEARERLRQTSRNSSRPPSSDLPWDKTGADNEDIPPQQDEPGEVDNATPDCNGLISGLQKVSMYFYLPIYRKYAIKIRMAYMAICF